MKVFSEGADGYREPLWQMTDMPIEANGEWWKGQVQINDHQVRSLKHENKDQKILKIFYFQVIFEILHSQYNNTKDGYAAIDSISFDYTEENSCELLPPDANVKPTDSPGSEPASADFEDCGWCDWSEDSGLNSEENFVWNRTTGADQDGEFGPTHDYDSTTTSNSFRR